MLDANRYGNALVEASEAQRTLLTTLFLLSRNIDPIETSVRDNKVRIKALEAFQKAADKLQLAEKQLTDLEQTIVDMEEYRSNIKPLRDMFAHNLSESEKTEPLKSLEEAKLLLNQFLESVYRLKRLTSAQEGREELFGLLKSSGNGQNIKGKSRSLVLVVYSSKNRSQWEDEDKVLNGTKTKSRKKIYLWDDNIMAAPPKVFAKVMDDLKKTGKPFQFRQGMDIRLMTEQKAKLLSEVKYHGDYIFAFDHYKMDDPNEKRQVEQTIKGLKIWRTHCRKSTKLYVLVAYDSQDETDIEGTFFRIKTLMEHGCLPYIMRFEEYNNSRFKSMYTQLARWCNQPSFFKKMSFRQYCVRNEEYHQGIQDLVPKGKYSKKLKIPKGYPRKEKYCSCYQTMLDFEAEFPEMAKKYFDLRFEELNPYKLVK